MKQIIFVIAIFAAILAATTTTHAQTAPKPDTVKTSVKYDKATDTYYTPARAKADGPADLTKGCEKSTAKYRDSRGNTWPVYKSKSGKIFALVTSQKSGKQYRKYLD